ncbi:MAG: NAD(P)/FAD-dependent oxidoreductase [Pseudomonadota bacterium]
MTETRYASLAELEDAIRAELSYLDFPPRDWLIDHRHESGEPVFDVVIEGGGMQGLAIAHALIRQRVRNIVLLDENPQGREGPWITYARMETLRTPKIFVGPDLGQLNLAVRTWYDIRHGPGSWDALAKVPKDEWMEYLNWFRRLLRLPVENGVTLKLVEPDGRYLRLTTESENGARTIYARKLIRTAGIAGCGGKHVPDIISENLPADRFAHSSDPIDFDALRGKTVGVVGSGASGFDNAATALEGGARSVDLFMRRPRIPTINIVRAMHSVGYLQHFGDLGDAERWRVMNHAARFTAPPPEETQARVTRHDNFHLRADSSIAGVGIDGDRIWVQTPHGRYLVDYLIAATGFAVDVSAVPELAPIAGDIALWQDRYSPPSDQANEELGRKPYLGRHFEFTAKDAVAAPHVGNIHEYGIASISSLGPICTGLHGMAFGVERLVRGVTRDLFVGDGAEHVSRILDVDEPPIEPDGEEDWTI